MRRHMCMDVMVSMDVMTTVFLLHDRLLSMLLLMCGCMYFGVMITMDVMRWLHDWDMNMLHMVYGYM